MIDLDEWIEHLGERDIEAEENDKYQNDLFVEYVLRKNDKNYKLRRELYNEYRAGTTPLFGEKGLRRQLAAIDLSYFGRAYLPHFLLGSHLYFMRN